MTLAPYIRFNAGLVHNAEAELVESLQKAANIVFVTALAVAESAFFCSVDLAANVADIPARMVFCSSGVLPFNDSANFLNLHGIDSSNSALLQLALNSSVRNLAT